MIMTATGARFAMLVIVVMVMMLVLIPAEV